MGDAIYVLATHGFHLFNMLRPEWVRQSPVPLSSGALAPLARSLACSHPQPDAYSGFGRSDPQASAASKEVRAHTNALYKLLQSVAEQLVRGV